MTTGDAAPVLLLHGWAGSFRETWQSTGVDALLGDSGRRVIGLDLLGHGASPTPHEPQAYADMSGWLLDAIVDEPRPIDAAGFSLGALTLLGALVREPDRFGSVLLSGIGNGVFDERDPAESSRIVDALEGRASETDTGALVFARYADAPGKDKAALTAIMKRPPSPPLDPSVLARIDNRVRVVIGDGDFAAPADRLAGAFPNADLVVLRNTDHFATPESFSFIDTLLDFFGA
ncbi:MAG: alpha/beta fold hydrolase [Ilumatobacteraceae bacterium]